MVASLKKHYRHIMYLGRAHRQIRKNFSIYMFIGEKGLWSPICIPPYIYKWFCHSNELDFFTGTWINLPLKVFINTSISFECFILKASLHILLNNHWVFIRITIFHFIPFSFKHFSLCYNKVATHHQRLLYRDLKVIGDRLFWGKQEILDISHSIDLWLCSYSLPCFRSSRPEVFSNWGKNYVKVDVNLTFLPFSPYKNQCE